MFLHRRFCSWLTLFLFGLSILFGVSSYSYAQVIKQDAEIAQQLAQGQGGIAIKENFYKVPKKTYKQLQKSSKTQEEFLQKLAAAKQRYPYKAKIGIYRRDNKKKEKHFKRYKPGWHVFTGAPGEYTITSFLTSYTTGMLNAHMASGRIFQRVTLKPGEIIYLGEVNSLSAPNPLDVLYATLDEAGAFRSAFPQSSQNFSTSNVLMSSDALDMVQGN